MPTPKQSVKKCLWQGLPMRDHYRPASGWVGVGAASEDGGGGREGSCLSRSLLILGNRPWSHLEAGASSAFNGN